MAKRPETDRVALRLTALLAFLMGAQAVWGRLMPDLYRDAPRIAQTWIGNDWVTLVVAMPILVLSALAAAGGGLRARIVWIGALAFAIYNYAFYMLGTVLNAAFPLYVALELVAMAAFGFALVGTRAELVARRLRPEAPVRLVAGYLVAVALVLSAVWAVLWAQILFGSASGGLGPEAFQIVAALDTTLLVPVMVLGGGLLWRRHPWGVVLAGVAAVQGALYLLVLLVNATVALVTGLAEPPGELPFWGLLAPLTLLAAVVHLHGLRPADD